MSTVKQRTARIVGRDGEDVAWDSVGDGAGGLDDSWSTSWRDVTAFRALDGTPPSPTWLPPRNPCTLLNDARQLGEPPSWTQSNSIQSTGIRAKSPNAMSRIARSRRV